MRRLAAALLGLAVATPAHADDAVPDATTIVVGLRLPRPVRDQPAATTVIDRAEIERTPRRTVDDLVRTLPSVATFRRSSSLVADPTSQGASLRGVGPSGVSRALVLEDGVPLNDPFGGWVYWRAIPLAGVDRVEVTPSGASAVLGNFALGGVMHLVSRRIRGRRLEASLTTGSYRTHRATLHATERRGGLGVAVDADALDSAGYAPIAPGSRGAIDGPAASRHAVGGVRAEWTRGRTRLRARARLFDQHLDAGTVHTTADVTAGSYGAGAMLVRDRGTFEVDVFGGHQRFGQERARVSEGRTSATRSSEQRTPSTSLGAVAHWTGEPIGAHTLVVAVDGLRVAGTATDHLEPAEPMPTSVLERAAGGEQRFAGVAVQDAVRVGARLEVHAALRADIWQALDGERTLTRASGEVMRDAFPDRTDLQLDPRLGVLYRVDDELSVRASAYRAFRAPTLNELYRSFQVGTVLTEANPALDAERVWGGEAGPEVIFGAAIARATAFWNELDDPIQNVTLAEPLPSGATRQRQNLGHARIAGLELEASWRPARRWIAAVGYTFVHAEVTDAPAVPDLVGKRLAQDPRHRATASLGFTDRRLFDATLQWRYLGGQFEDDLNTLPMGDAHLVDAVIARELGAGLRGFVAVENLLDTRYLVGRAGVDTVGAPRMIQLGVQLRLAPSS